MELRGNGSLITYGFHLIKTPFFAPHLQQDEPSTQPVLQETRFPSAGSQGQPSATSDWGAEIKIAVASLPHSLRNSVEDGRLAACGRLQGRPFCVNRAETSRTGKPGEMHFMFFLFYGGTSGKDNVP